MPAFLIDANLPRYLSIWNSADFVFVVDLHPEMPDQEIWHFARQNALTIVTKDADFSARVMLEPNGPHVIHMRLGNMKIRDLHGFLSRNWAGICEQSRAHQLVEVFDDHMDCFE